MDPSSTRVGKHSRSCAVSVAERDHVYSRHASPRRHVCRCEELEGENAAHSPRSGCRRLPQEWHCSPGTPVSCTWPQQGVTISQSSHRVLICSTCCCCCCSCCCCSRRFSPLLPPEPRRGVSGISAAHIASPPAACRPVLTWAGWRGWRGRYPPAGLGQPLLLRGHLAVTEVSVAHAARYLGSSS